jgi:hypothetical protein
MEDKKSDLFIQTIAPIQNVKQKWSQEFNTQTFNNHYKWGSLAFIEF